MRYIITLLLVGLFLSSTLSAQSVRKPWTELTSSERSDYVNAINSLSNADVRNLADEHARLFSAGIHGVPEFLPWHRIFLEYFEDLLQDQDPNVTIPYWNWHESWSSSSLLFENSSGANTGLLGHDVDASIWEDGGTLFNRAFTSQPQPSDSYASIQNFTNFNNSLQFGAHGAGHVFINGDMNSIDSPIDPMFYLHHAMVDKAWYDWREDFPSASVSALSTSVQTFNVYGPSTVNGQALVDSKDFGVWYADNNLLKINDFDFTQDQEFKYSTGNIEISDITLSSSTDFESYIDSGSSYSITIEGPFDAPNGSTLKIDTY